MITKTLTLRSLHLLLAVTALGLVALAAETVYLAPKGKTYHASKSCISLSRTAQILSADRTVAEAHGLTACKICYRPKRAKTTNEQWAKKSGSGL
jgi:D-alanyl-D-alanine dipeptidase